MDLSSPANKPAEQPDQLKSKPMRLCDVKLPSAPPHLDIPSGSRLEGRISRPSSRLEGRVARGGEILPTEPTVRETIRTLKETYGEAGRATVREQLERMRLNQERRADQLRQQLAREARRPPRMSLMGEDPAHSVGSTPSHSHSAHSVDPVTTTVTWPHPDLLRRPPMFQKDMFPDEMSNEEIYQETLKLFDGEPTPNFGRRPLHPINLASSYIQPAQPEIFEVPDPAGDSPQNPFDPYYECNGVDCNGRKEHNLFRRHVGALDIVASRRWNSPYITGNDELKEMLKQIKKMYVRAPIQIMYIKYATRLKGNHRTRTPNALRFIHAVLTAHNLRHELPLLLSRFKPLITDRHTTLPWPTPIDYRNAMEHWSCYCVNAAIYVFNHLSGPIVFNSDWLDGPNVPLDLVMSFGDILKDDRQDPINDLRHQVYRQFGYAHIQAILQGDPKFI
ncbi:hypothetical protein AAVH_43655 [Aphelenchoides avenae]|nr:hypothetical protein AAVH_43655 [Aphelenchus avenae]